MSHPPRMDAILDATATSGLPRELRKRLAREILAEARTNGSIPAVTEVAIELVRRERELVKPSYVRCINATGVVLHTGLGRAPLGKVAERVAEAVRGYTIVEVDRESGERNQRENGLLRFLRDLTGAESATVVNNNAAATLLALAALGRGREVIVSRSELVEIGGGFRVPDVMAESGAKLVEVGTTNRTRIADYERAITEDTALLLKVHQSNFRIVGFTEEVGLPALVSLGAQRGVPVVFDMGSGCLTDLGPADIPDEPTVRQVLEAGVDLALFSGDKVLGGPQAGVIVGKGELVARIRRHPLFRAVRPDKMTLVALEETLRAYWLDRAGDVLTQCLLFADVNGLRERALTISSALRGVEVKPSEARVGSGAAPAVGLRSWALVIAENATSVQRRLRLVDPPVFGRVFDGALWLDLRTVLPEEDQILRDILQAILSEET